MRYLFSGMMQLDEFEHLISMSGLRSEGMANSLRSHLVRGMSEVAATAGNDVTQSNFSRDRNKLEKLYGQIQKYNEIIQVTRIK